MPRVGRTVRARWDERQRERRCQSQESVIGRRQAERKKVISRPKRRPADRAKRAPRGFSSTTYRPSVPSPNTRTKTREDFQGRDKVGQ